MSRRPTGSKSGSKISFDPGTVVEALSDQERYHYEKAVLEMLESFKLGALRVHLSGSGTDFTGSSDDERPTDRSKGTHATSGKGSYIVQRKPTKPRQKARQHESDVTVIYKELSSISNGLKHESRQLHEKEKDLQERERALDKAEIKMRKYEGSIDTIIKEEVEKQVKEADKVFEDNLQQKNEEVNKWRNSFKISKQANEALRKQVRTLTEECKTLEERIGSLQIRLTNSQRKNEILTQQCQNATVAKVDSSLKDGVAKKTKAQEQTSLNDRTLEFLTLTLEWIYDVHFKQQTPLSSATEMKEFDVVAETTRERCRKALPMVCSVLPLIEGERNKVTVSFLRFIIFTIHWLPSTQRGTLATSFRRIGEELLRKKVSGSNVDGWNQAKIAPVLNCYFRSEDDEVRILSSIVLLATLTKVDEQVEVLESLKLDLRSEYAKQLFLQYDGTKVLQPYMKASQKPLLNYTMDVLMMLAVESPFLVAFSEAISTEQWLSNIILLLQSQGLEVKVMEKIVILLQKLSKLRSNKKLFESLQVEAVVHELIRQHKTSSPFLAVNLQSTLFNINAMKSGLSSAQRFKS